MLAFQLLPERASDIGRSVDFVFYALLVVCGLVAAGVCLAILFFCFRYRRGSPAARQRHHGTSWKLEAGWTSVTFLAFLGIFIWGGVVYFHMSQPPADAAEIHVIGKQWMWKTQHPNGRREINELHLLLGKPVKLIMTSQDVIHSYFIPAFRSKQDVLPGRYTVQWFTPTKPGTYHLFCAEYCGTDHSRMIGSVYVLEPAGYARWLAAQQPTESMAAAGARLFTARGCSGCHSPNAAVRAPLLTGIYNKPVALANGSVIIAGEQYMQDSILLPQKEITAGYEPVMPTYQGVLSEEEVMQLVAYLKSLTNEKGAEQ
ncbi:MAG: cytochrome c oxidase subunit II [Cytophagaceae bacterium]|nr:MAG: cytochrome c oxidase subunit II [Cytophagaceae bacterium]